MAATQTISRVVDLLDDSRNVFHGMSVREARAIVALGNPNEIRKIRGGLGPWYPRPATASW